MYTYGQGPQLPCMSEDNITISFVKPMKTHIQGPRRNNAIHVISENEITRIA